MNHREAQRNLRQGELDRLKTPSERNKLGQFATPTPLATDILSFGLALLPESAPVRFLDPAVGTGAFYSALESQLGVRSLQWARGFEIDAHYGKPAQSLWQGAPLKITLADFTRQVPPASEVGKANLLICNPPYVRHHHIDGKEKVRLQAVALDRAHIQLSGLAGLYCYFLALSQTWMSRGCIAGWLIPSEFMDVNYGQALKQYLLREVTLLRIHRFDPNEVQFDDALVSSAVVWFRNTKPSREHPVTFSYGGKLTAPALVRSVAARDLERTHKWTKLAQQDVSAAYGGLRLGDLFAIKRGLATGGNSFFILHEAQAKALKLPKRFLRPVLPGSRSIQADEIAADAAGVPLLEKRLFLIDCDLPAQQIERNYPALWSYLQTGIGRVSAGYLCRSRRCWYMQEKRPPAPIVCTYLGRSDRDGRPFRFLLNHSRATATNVYLMLYPKPTLATRLAENPAALRLLWEALNRIGADTLLGNGRVYGGGLHKLEPKELGNVPAADLAAIVGLAAGPRMCLDSIIT